MLLIHNLAKSVTNQQKYSHIEVLRSTHFLQHNNIHLKNAENKHRL